MHRSFEFQCEKRTKQNARRKQHHLLSLLCICFTLLLSAVVFDLDHRNRLHAEYDFFSVVLLLGRLQPPHQHLLHSCFVCLVPLVNRSFWLWSPDSIAHRIEGKRCSLRDGRCDSGRVDFLLWWLRLPRTMRISSALNTKWYTNKWHVLYPTFDNAALHMQKMSFVSETWKLLQKHSPGISINIHSCPMEIKNTGVRCNNYVAPCESSFRNLQFSKTQVNSFAWLESVP